MQDLFGRKGETTMDVTMGLIFLAGIIVGVALTNIYMLLLPGRGRCAYPDAQ
jgi:hypothetical protein